MKSFSQVILEQIEETGSYRVAVAQLFVATLTETIIKLAAQGGDKAAMQIEALGIAIEDIRRTYPNQEKPPLPGPQFVDVADFSTPAPQPQPKTRTRK